MKGVAKLLWPGNSPDLNAIEPCWFYLKRVITEKGPPANRAEAVERWTEAFKLMGIERVRVWIERILYHIQEIIRLEGGNEYKEGRAPRSDRPNSDWDGVFARKLKVEVNEDAEKEGLWEDGGMLTFDEIAKLCSKDGDCVIILD